MAERHIALVTGASRRVGIGAAICRALAANGHDIAFTYWKPFDRASYADADEDGPDGLAGELREMGSRAEAFEADLSLAETPANLLDRVTDRLGFPRVLVNNAAHSTHTSYDELDAGSLDAHYAVNVRATALLVSELARRWPGGPGRVVNMTSGQARGPMPNELAYAASKGAIEAFTLSVSPAIAELGITINAVNPGPTDTGWMDDALKQELLPKFPFGRIGGPADAARLVAFLASDDAAWITGQVIHSEGGFLRR
ncbi:MAG: SDR family oxidoreductase [Thermomicrobiales bacterium]|nr:SDR family oxidoreductase [Thermomicrobiales bacterium]